MTKKIRYINQKILTIFQPETVTDSAKLNPKNEIKRNMHKNIYFFTLILVILPFFIFCGCQEIMDKYKLERTKKNHLPEKEKDELQKKLESWENDLEELEDEFKEKLMLVSKMGQLSKKLALGYTRMGRYELAAQEYHKAIQLEAGVSSKQKIYKKAIKYYKKTFLYGRVDDDLLYQAGLIYSNASMAMAWEEKSLTAAMMIFNGLLKINPKNPRVLFQRAMLFYHAYGMPERAIKDLKKLIKITPDEVPPYELLGHIYYSGQKPELALRYYERALTKISQYLDQKNQDKEKINSYRNIKKIVETLQSNFGGYKMKKK